MTMRAAIGQVFAFFFALGRKSGRARTFALLGLIPVALAVVVRIVLRGREGDMAAVFSEILMVFFLQIYIVVLSLFYGTSITAEEIENRTLTYLVTRPIPKPAVVLGKYAAYAASDVRHDGRRPDGVVLPSQRVRLGDPRPLCDVPQVAWRSSASASSPTPLSSPSSGRSSSGPSSWGSSSASAGRPSSSISRARRRSSPSSTT